MTYLEKLQHVVNATDYFQTITETDKEKTVKKFSVLTRQNGSVKLVTQYSETILLISPYSVTEGQSSLTDI